MPKLKTKVRFLFEIAYFTVLVLLTLGCGGCGQKADNALPRLPDNYEIVRNEILSQYGEVDFLNIPDGNLHSAYQLLDTNNDGKKEMLVFFTVTGTPYEVVCALFRQNKDSWNEFSEYKIYSGGIRKLEFADVNSDGLQEILIMSGDVSDVENSFFVLSVRDATISQLYTASCVDAASGDIDHDGFCEIGCLMLDSISRSGELKILKYGWRGFEILDSVSLNPYAVRYTEVLSYPVNNNGKQGFFVESINSGEAYCNDLIILQGSHYINIFYSQGQYSSFSSGNLAHIPIRDINDDGTYEMPFLVPMHGYEAASREKTLWVAVWKKWDGASGLVTTAYSYENIGDGYSFVYPESWPQKNISADLSQEDGDSVLSLSVRDEKGKIVENILILRAFKNMAGDKINDGSQEKSIPENYTLLAERRNIVFAVAFPDGETQLNQDFIKNIANLKKYFKLAE